MSDHDIIEITTNLDDDGKNINNKKVNEQTKEDDLRQLNFHNKDIPWAGIKQILMELDWPKIFKEKNVVECTQIFLWIVTMICCQLIPKKINKYKEKIPRERKKMLNRIKMLKRKRHNTKNRNDRIKLEECITETEKRLINVKKKSQEKERKC